jgi:hypothetical protein
MRRLRRKLEKPAGAERQEENTGRVRRFGGACFSINSRFFANDRRSRQSPRVSTSKMK